MALRLRYSDKALHRGHAPADPVEPAWSSNCSSSCAWKPWSPDASLPGPGGTTCATASSAGRADFHRIGLPKPARHPDVHTVAQMCLVAPDRLPVLEDTEDLIEARAPGIAERARARPWPACAGWRHDQAAYRAVHALELPGRGLELPWLRAEDDAETADEDDDSPRAASACCPTSKARARA
jgi:hypothetical protein